MEFSSAWRRGLASVAAVGIAVGLATVLGAPAATAVTCPAVGPRGVVTPAPAPDVDWSGCKLTDANLSASDLSGANLSGADLANAELFGSDLSGANLTDANLNTFYVSNLTLTGANLSGTGFAYNGDLTGVVSGGITGTPANLPYYPDGQYVLGGGYIAGPGADLAGVDLAGVNLTGAALDANADLTDANLTGANLTSAVLGADLSGTKLAGANLTDIDSRANTGTPASLPPHWAYVNGYLLGPTVEAIYADLSGDDLADLDLAGGQFNYANLSRANLNGANLSKTYLWFANLTGATAAGASFAGASWNSTTCPDGTNSNIYINGCFSPRDTTRPVLHLNVKNGHVFAVNIARHVQCTATDKYQPIIGQPKLTITGHSARGLGKFTATCSGATNLAGLVARPVSATYWVAYRFDGMEPAQGAVVPTHPRTLTVTFALSATAEPISAATGQAMARAKDVRMTLRGPGIRPKTVTCSYAQRARGFVCDLPLPLGIETGRQHRYTLTAYENNGFGFVIAPGESTAENPAVIHFGNG